MDRPTLPTLPVAFRYAVVEDEPAARLQLVRMLARFCPDAKLLWQAEEGEAAFRRLLDDPVDVLFLDVVFPPQGAFHLLELARASGHRLPKIVFVTGRDDQAVRAFEWSACDYLVKPLSVERVKAMLERVRASLVSPDLEALLQTVRAIPRPTLAERFTVELRDRTLVFRWSEVMYFTTEFRQVFAQTSRGKVPIDQALEDLEAELGDRFMRIHRSNLINLDYLLEVHHPASRAGEAVMQDGARLAIARARLEELKARLGQLG